MNLDRLIFGSNILEDNYIRDVDPRIKLISVLIIILATALVSSSVPYLILTALLITGMISIKPGWKLVWVNIRPFILLSLLTLLLHLIFSSGEGRLLISFAGFDITSGGVVTGAVFAWRILLFFAAAVLFNLTTDPLDISDAVTRLLKLLKIFRIPVDQLGLLVFLAFRFVPIISEESQAIYAAQVSRGYDPRGGFIKRLRNSIPLLSAVLASSIRRAGHMAEALEARGFHPDRERSSLRIFKIRFSDCVFLTVVLIASAGSVFLAYYA
jgi:energy-coupling factor transport system permease protein